MKNWLTGCALVALWLTLMLGPARADVARPDVSPQPHGPLLTPMRVEANTQAREAKLRIPRAVWQQVNAGAVAGSGAHVGLFGRGFTPGGAQTIMAGLFLSGACACGGLWFVRARRQLRGRTRAGLDVALLLLCGGAVAGVAYANVGPPSIARVLTAGILVPDARTYGATGQVQIEVSDEVDRVTLVLPVPRDARPGGE